MQPPRERDTSTVVEVGETVPSTSATSAASYEIETDNKNVCSEADTSKSPVSEQAVNSNILFILSDDPVEWEINDSLRNYVAKYGFKQNLDADFKKSKREYNDHARYFTRSMFERELKNCEKIQRDWLIYSQSSGRVYCGPCLAFNGGSQFGVLKEGFNDWKNAKRLAQHENSPDHKSSVLQMLERGKKHGRIDHQVERQLEEEKVYWKSVLRRVVETVKSLVSRGLPLRGDNETIGSVHNGNFLMAIELIAQFDPFMATHIAKYGNPGSGRTNYLSSTIYEEFVEILASKVTELVLSEIHIAKYFSIIVDSTPDLTHVDQLSLIIRYVQSDGTPIERFIKFIPNVGHKAELIKDAVVELIEELKINMNNCRGQSYDNAANMSGPYNGLQAKIKQISPTAEYVPCAAHSLNLVGECAAKCCESAVLFFDTLQEVYTFFTASTARWNILFNQYEKAEKKRKESKENKRTHILQNLSKTRWSARSDACVALFESYWEVISALFDVEEDDQQNPNAKCEAKGIRLKLESFEMAFMVVFWGFLLERFNLTNKLLQDPEIDIFTAVQLYDSLIALISESREKFDGFETEARTLLMTAAESYQKDKGRKRKRTLRSGEKATGEVEFNGRDTMRVETFLVIIDKLITELKKRRNAYEMYYERFFFLLNLTALSSEELKKKAEALVQIYPDDIEECFIGECIQFQALCNSQNYTEDAKTPTKLLKKIRNQNIHSVFPNIDIALRMCVCTPIANCSAERSFSCLRRVLNYLRSSMNEERLSALGILQIENEILQSLDYEEIIDAFAAKKSRRVLLH
ncbi:52 kDa repressor of the inhibitor of the protein kinase-like [Vigna radiata var. radiata]|nr:52 kDa repressor of the inhibitor of the protein kinase-like [Vigna radiata var. radiata]